jgi:predicted PurR-regulated permease PerM
MERVRRISSQKVMVVLIVIFVVAYMIRPVLLPFALAAAIALATTPAVEWLSARAGWRRWISAVVVFLGLVLLLGALGWLAVPSLAHELKSIVTNLESIVGRAIASVIGQGEVQLLGRTLTAQQLTANAIDMLRDWFTQAGRLMTFAMVGSAAFFGFFLFAVLLLFFLVSGPRIGEGLVWLAPPKQRPFVEHTWSRVDPVLKRYFIGLACVVAYASTAAYIGLGLVLDLPGAVLLSLLTGILELIPMVGPAASALLAGLVAIQNATGIWAIVGYAIYATLLRLSIDQLVGPLVLGKAAYLHPVLIIFCYLAGGYLFGVVGLVLAVPIALTIRIVLRELYEGDYALEHSEAAAPEPEPEERSGAQQERPVSLHPALGGPRRRDR